MKKTILDTIKPLTLIGGGECSAEDVITARSIAPTFVAADGGADLALKAGVELAAVIGDMDSISVEARAQIPTDIFHQIPEQNSTDFDKALRNLSTPLVIAIGFTGGQVDHALAALNTLVVRCNRRVILLGNQDIVFLCPPQLSLALEPRTRVSLFPMGPVRGRSSGLKWAIDGIDFAPGHRSGTSNCALGDITLQMEAPHMLCILPRALILQVASALQGLGASAQWPARAE